MKKIFTLIALVAISISANAQATPNAGFESWTHVAAAGIAPAYDTPDSWNTLNSTIVTSTFGVVTCTKATAAGEFHSGVAAIKLQTLAVFGTPANGIATTGTINTGTQSVTGGIPYTGHPDSIVGWYRCAPVGVDSAFIELQLLGAGGNTDTVGYIRFRTTRNTVGTFTRFSDTIHYRNANAVVTACWILSSSADATTHVVNSALWVDDLQMVTNPTIGIAEQTKLEVSVFPNPAINYLQINNPAGTKANVSIYDVTGRKVLEQMLVNTTTSLDLADLHSGLYIYSIIDENKKAIKTGKVIVQK